MRPGLGAVILLALVAACAGYRPGSYQSPKAEFGPTRAVSGCLDIAVASMPDPIARGPVAAITLANRCERGVWLDFQGIRATGRLRGGERVPLKAFDPNGEMAPALLDGRGVAREVIEYSLSRPKSGAQEDSWPLEVCLDFTAVERAPTAGTTGSVLCIAVDGPTALVAVAP